MNTSDLLEQLLRAGQGSMAQQSGGGASAQGGLGGLLGGLLGGGAGSSAGAGGLGSLLGGLLGGGSVVGGSTQTRSGGGTNYELAAALSIDPELRVHLEQQAQGGVA
ncbi:hypothetical protein ACYZT3_17150 [Pseudomonas sp. MDT1-16]